MLCGKFYAVVSGDLEDTRIEAVSPLHACTCVIRATPTAYPFYEEIDILEEYTRQSSLIESAREVFCRTVLGDLEYLRTQEQVDIAELVVRSALQSVAMSAAARMEPPGQVVMFVVHCDANGENCSVSMPAEDLRACLIPRWSEQYKKYRTEEEAKTKPLQDGRCVCFVLAVHSVDLHSPFLQLDTRACTSQRGGV